MHIVLSFRGEQCHWFENIIYLTRKLSSYASVSDSAMPRGRGKEWMHVKVLKSTKTNFLIECNFCNKQFWVGSGNRVRAHLGVETISGVAKCEKIPDNLVAIFMKAENKKLCENEVMSRKRALDISTSGKHLIPSTSHESDLKQPKITAIRDKQKKHDVDQAVARMCYSTGISLNISLRTLK